jgi:preprotein translocase subunit SecD
MRLGTSLVLLWLAAAGAADLRAQRAVTLAVHILVACPAGAPGSAAKLQTAAGPLCLDRKPFLTQDDVEAAEIQPSSKGYPMVFLTFRKDAAMRELQVTRKNIGNHVGIVLNGRVVGTPLISAASRLLYIDDHYTQPQAEAVVGAFNKLIAARKQAKK